MSDDPAVPDGSKIAVAVVAVAVAAAVVAAAVAPPVGAAAPAVAVDSSSGASDDRTHTLTVAGAGTPTNYGLAVSGDLAGADDTLELWDDLVSNLASGWVTTPSQIDRYRFSGNVLRFSTDGGDVRVAVDGRPVDATPDWGANVTATPIATDARVEPGPEEGGRADAAGGDGETVWFAFRAAAGHAVAVTGQFAEGNEWTLYGPDGEILQSIRSTAGGDVTSVGAVAPRNGTYYLRAETEIARGPFAVETAPPDPFEPNDDRESAVPIGTGTNRSGTIAEGDADWFAVEVDGRANLSARVGVDPGDAVPYRGLTVGIYDADGDRIGRYVEGNETGYRAVDSGAATARQAARIEDAGTYYVRVAGAGEFDGFVGYELAANASDPRAAEVRTLSIVGRGVDAAYRFAVTGDLRPVDDSVEAIDTVDDADVEGYVTDGRTDRFRFTGAVTEFEFRRGVAEVRIDGRPVDYADFGNDSG